MSIPMLLHNGTSKLNICGKNREKIYNQSINRAEFDPQR